VDKLRELIARAGLSQRAAASRLGVDERAMRRYCTGRLQVPPYVLLALSALPPGQQPQPR
jgi:transcriptional regulator with XRE-family HTH domain